MIAQTRTLHSGDTMTRDEAFTRCPSDSYVEFYSGQWLVVPYEPVTQPAFFAVTPRRVVAA